MSRIIKLESPAKERTHLNRAIVLALRELMKQADTSEQTQDLVAFIVMALQQIYQTVEESVTAWEKKGYWVKADRFRLDWIWAEDYSSKLGKELIAENWVGVAGMSARISEKMQKIEVPVRNKIGQPWQGAWKKYNESRGGG